MIGFIYFRDLGDVSQMVLKVKRENMLRFIRNENRLLLFGLAALALATIAHFGFAAGSRGWWWAGLLLSIVFYGFPYIWVHVGLRNQKRSARYYSIDEAKEFVSPSNQVIVNENNGVARAHPQAQLLRPHLAGNEEGLVGRIPDHERKFSPQPLEAGGSVLLVQVQSNLAVGPRSKSVPALLQFGHDGVVVVEFTIGHDVKSTVLVGNGLISACQVNDTEPSVP